MTGIGVKDYKDLSDKQKNLPNLTGPTDHGAWEKDVFRLAGDIMDLRVCRRILSIHFACLIVRALSSML